MMQVKKRNGMLILLVLVLILQIFTARTGNVALAVNTTLDNCDSTSGWTGGSPVSLDTTNMKEGSGCLTRTASTTDWFKKTFNPAVNSGVTQTNGYLHLWLYVSDVTKISADGQFEITSSGGPDVNEYAWLGSSLSLVNGWNELNLKISNAIKTGTPNLSAINYFRIYRPLSASITCKLDDLRFTDSLSGATPTPTPTFTPTPSPTPTGAGTATPTPTPTLGPTSTPTPTSGGITMLDKCDSTSGWTGNNPVSLDTTNMREGTGCLTMTGSGTDWFKKTFSPVVNSGVTESNGYLHLWIYVSDVTKFAAGGGQIEITSSGGPDINEYAWVVANLSLVNGWNELSLKISNATKLGTPNLSAINFFRLYQFLSASITCKIDAIGFTATPPGATPTPTPTPGSTATPTPTPGAGNRNPKIVTTNYTTNDIVVADYDVTDYGADNTGVNDSTAAIQNAINDCYNFGGGTVWMPAGTYKVTNTILVKAFVTLRGDWKDPDTGGGTYGTVVSAQVASGASGPTLFRIGGSAGVVGITTYYPNQNASSPVAYNYTFEIPGRAWIGEENYMLSSIINCTMLNSYKGIGISTMANDRGKPVSSGQVHEMVTIKNVKGTVLYRGVEAYNGADVGTWEHVKFYNSYWANAGTAYNAPSESTLNTYTRTNATAFVFGDLEWEQFYGLECSQYNIGINTVAGQRISFAGIVYGSIIQNTNTAVKVDSMDTRWNYGLSLLRCTISGSSNAITVTPSNKVQATDCTISGAYNSSKVTVTNPGTSPASYPERASIPKTSRAVLYDVSKAPYNAPCTSSTGTTLPTVDATAVIQNALNDAGNAGGGLVYVPAGWYKINTHLTVPANVELRGCSSVPNRDQTGRSAGTVLFAYEGSGTSTPDTATAFITVNAGTQCAGVSGLRVFYPNNNPKVAITKYPYTIRGSGTNVYVVNAGLPNSYNAVDLTTNRCDNHYVRKVVGCTFAKHITLGLSTEGWTEGILTNPNAVCRVGYNISGWIKNDTASGDGYGGDGGAELGTYVIPSTRANEKLLTVNEASNEHLLNCFAYGTNTGLTVTSGTATMFNFGTDNLGTGGYGINVSGGTVKVCNYARYNGSTSTGTVTIYNPMILP